MRTPSAPVQSGTEQPLMCIRSNACKSQQLHPAQPSSVRGQHLPLVDRFLAALAAAKAPAPRAKPPGKLVDVERMFHEVADLAYVQHFINGVTCNQELACMHHPHGSGQRCEQDRPDSHSVCFAFSLQAVPVDCAVGASSACVLQCSF